MNGVSIGESGEEVGELAEGVAEIIGLAVADGVAGTLIVGAAALSVGIGVTIGGGVLPHATIRKAMTGTAMAAVNLLSIKCNIDATGRYSCFPRSPNVPATFASPPS